MHKIVFYITLILISSAKIYSLNHIYESQYKSIHYLENSEDTGIFSDHKSLLLFSLTNKKITGIYTTPLKEIWFCRSLKSRMYIMGKSGVWLKSNHSDWQCIINSGFSSEAFMVRHHNTIIIVDRNNAWSIHKAKSKTFALPRKSKYEDAEVIENNLYLISENTLWKKTPESAWHKVLQIPRNIQENQTSSPIEPTYKKKLISTKWNNQTYLFWIIDKGIWIINDQENNTYQAKKVLLVTPDTFLGIWEDGVLVLNEDLSILHVNIHGNSYIWPIERLLPTKIQPQKILIQDKNIIAFCNRSVFSTPFQTNFYTSNTKKDFLSENCPSIQAVFKRSLEYFGINPELYRNWEKLSQKRALLPKVSCSIGYDSGNNIELYTSTTTQYAFEGPYDKDWGYDIKLSWDLQNLFFPLGDFKDIDSRRKLQNQQREDLLNEITRIYFLRKKELYKIKNQITENNNHSIYLIEELTAQLDAYTGNWFSTQCKKSSHHKKI